MRSFGSGTHVKLPGPTPDKPNVYDFNTSYEEMYKDLLEKDRNLYLDLIISLQCCSISTNVNTDTFTMYN